MIYPSIRIEGSILSPDILEKLDDANGQHPADFGLETSAKVKCKIWSTLDTHSDLNWTPIPEKIGQSFRY